MPRTTRLVTANRNPDPFGAFAEGLAPGISGGVESYANLQIAKINRDEKRALADSEMSIKLISNKNLPLAVRKRAYKHLQQTSKAWGGKMQFPDIPDEAWESGTLQGYLTRLNNIVKDKNIPFEVKMESAVALEQEAMAAMDIEDVSRVAGAFKPAKERIKAKSYATGMGLLAKDEAPILRGQLLSMSPKGQEVMATQAKARLKEKGIGEKPTYKMVEGDLVRIKGDNVKVIRKGSDETRAYYNAVRDPEWKYLEGNEAGKFELVQQHLRIIQGKKKPPSKTKTPRQTAIEALKGAGMPLDEANIQHHIKTRQNK